MATKFFDERKDQSEVKARIIQKYFYAWAKILMPSIKRAGNGRLAYIDLYAGPGRYKDGSASTPLLVAQHAIEEPDLSERLLMLFNDVDEGNTSTLKTELEALPNFARLQNAPDIRCGKVNEDAEKFFASFSMVPSFTFFDPFGYVGLSLGIIKAVIKDWGCDCVFFFNYNRINMGISNELVEKHMKALFGDERAEALKKQLEGASPNEREELVLEALAVAIKGMGGNYVLAFVFKNQSGTRTSHALVFVSKHFLGYSVMKGVMAKESSTQDQGVYTFQYSPASAETPFLFSFNRPLDALHDDLLKTFAGQTLTMKEIYEQHSVDTPYLPTNYKKILLQLEEEKKIITTPHKAKSFADHVQVTFPAE